MCAKDRAFRAKDLGCLLRSTVFSVTIVLHSSIKVYLFKISAVRLAATTICRLFTLRHIEQLASLLNIRYFLHLLMRRAEPAEEGSFELYEHFRLFSNATVLVKDLSRRIKFSYQYLISFSTVL
jgi:hypothetical protein